MAVAAVMFVAAAFLVSCSKDNATGKTIITQPVDPPKPATPVTYSLVWSDEFNGDSVDPANWTMETGSLNVNNEKEYYQAANATVENGNLVITAKREDMGGFPYTSSRMNSLGKVSAKYGRIEARIKIPLGAGLWPAFWMMGTDLPTVNWPNCGEIDIMEHVNADDLFYGTIHWNGGNGHVQYGDKTAIANPDDYHIYAVEWDNAGIRWYIDNTLFLTANTTNNINNTGAFQQPFFILLNMAVGGDFPKVPVDETKLPAKMYVDYVRVYKAN